MAGNFFTGTPPKNYQQSLLGPEQLPTYNQLQGAAQRPGAGGAFGDAADYYRGNLSNNPTDFDAFAAPEMRRYNEQIIPDLAEQFAGMGAGGLSSSGFRNSAVSAGTDLSERLAQIRANLRSQSAQGLQGIGEQALRPYYENIQEEAKPGFLDYAGPAVGGALTAFAGPLAGAAGAGLTSWLSQSMKGKSSPYGGQASASVGQPGSVSNNRLGRAG